MYDYSIDINKVIRDVGGFKFVEGHTDTKGRLWRRVCVTGEKKYHEGLWQAKISEQTEIQRL